MLLRRCTLTALFALAAACGDDTSSPTGDGDAVSDDVGAATDAGDAGSSGDTGSAGDDATETDADAAADAGPCRRPTISCVGACRLDFFGVSSGRDNVLAVELQNDIAAPMSVVNVAIEPGGSPYVRLSESWYNYMDRAANGTWEPSGDGLGFSAVGTPIPIGADETFTVDVAFDEHEATGPQCPDGDTRNCATLVVSFDDCAGGTVEQRVPVQI